MRVESKMDITCLPLSFIFSNYVRYAFAMDYTRTIDWRHLAGNKYVFLNSLHKTCIMSTTRKESFAINGESLLKKVKELIEEGNIRKITIHDKTGKELMSFPLTVGVVGAVFAPVLAAVGALAALIGECTITVERDEKVESN